MSENEDRYHKESRPTPLHENQSPAPAREIADESRRDFFKVAGGAGALTATASMGLGGILAIPAEVQADEVEPPHPNERQEMAFRIRKQAARAYLDEEILLQSINGDEDHYGDRRACFSKCLPHDDLGEVNPRAYNAFLEALSSGDPDAFEFIPLSGSAERKLANPQAAYAFDMMGVDCHATTTPPAPAFASAEAAAEMGEVYWQALTRDVPFKKYEKDKLIAAAVADLNQFSDIKAPTENGEITPGTLFRGDLWGDLRGPYISQFLWMDVLYGPSTLVQRYPVPKKGENFMTDYEEWLVIQRGAAPRSSIKFDSKDRYIYNGRALGEYVHKDVLFQAYFNAALIIAGFGSDALDRGNPYLSSDNQDGFVTFGGAHLFDMVAKAARVGLEGAWFHKWLVHRRLRAEMFSGRIENQLKGRDYGIDPEIFESDALVRVLDAYGTALLPQAYPEGSPTHPAYPAGHSTVAGACATMLKAFVNEDFVLPDPVEASAKGDKLKEWKGEDLTLGYEINKLASNISVGRCIAGVHYRSDSSGLQVGEAQAIGILKDYSSTYNEYFDGFTLTKFDGERIRIVDGEVESEGY